MNKRKSIPKEVRDRVKQKYNGRCAYCGELHEKLVIDHLVAIAYHGGTNDEENLMPACFSCNSLKTVYTLEQFRRTLSEQIIKARKYSVNFRFAEKYGQIEIKETPIVFYFEKIKQQSSNS